MMKVGLIGWRGMVGSVLLQRMREENDFVGIEPVFFSTSQAGQPAPMNTGTLKNASDAKELKKLDIIITCQGGDLYQNDPSGASQRGMARILDRRCIDTEDGGGCGDHS